MRPIFLQTSVAGVLGRNLPANHAVVPAAHFLRTSLAGILGRNLPANHAIVPAAHFLQTSVAGVLGRNLPANHAIVPAARFSAGSRGSLAHEKLRTIAGPERDAMISVTSKLGFDNELHHQAASRNLLASRFLVQLHQESYSGLSVSPLASPVYRGSLHTTLTEAACRLP